MMKKFSLVVLLCLVTIDLAACRNDSNSNDYGYDNNRDEISENGVSYEPEEANRITDSQQENNNNQRPENSEISLEQAIRIAYDDLEDRGISATFREDSGMALERGQWVWELLFATEGERMPFIEYYISLEDGSIVKFEWDD